MKFLRYVYGLLLSLPFVVSCSETGCIEEENYIEYGRKITIQATQEEREMESRTILQEDLSVFWNPGDEISLFFMRGENGGNRVMPIFGRFIPIPRRMSARIIRWWLPCLMCNAQSRSRLPMTSF